MGTGPKLFGASKQVELAHGRGEVAGSLPRQHMVNRTFTLTPHPILAHNGDVDCSDAISAMQRHPSTVTKEGNRPMTTTTSDLGSTGCAVAPADSDNREKRDESSIVTRAASKALDKTQSPTALGKQAGDALKEENVLQPDFGSPSLPASTPEDLLTPASNASSPALPF